MTAEEAKTVVRRLFEESCNDGRLEVADELMADDYVDHSPVQPPIPGPAGFKARMTMLRESLGARIQIDDMAAEGDKVWFRWTMHGRHDGPFAGVEATGRELRLTGMNIERVVEGKVVEHWSEFDRMQLFEQLGATPPGPPPAS